MKAVQWNGMRAQASEPMNEWTDGGKLSVFIYLFVAIAAAAAADHFIAFFIIPFRIISWPFYLLPIMATCVEKGAAAV